MGNKRKPEIDWFPLDNAAKIYPPIMNRELSSVFRISCMLAERVRIGSLIKAVEIVKDRFPYFNVTLRKGFFWYFLEHGEHIRPSVTGEEELMLTAFPSKSVSHALYRVQARGCRISVEFLHIITDGGGALEFFRSLLVTYFRLCGINVPYSYGIINPESQCDKEETEDAFKKYYTSDLPHPRKLEDSWHLPVKIPGELKVNITEALLDSEALKKETNKYGVTVTEYIASVFLYCLQSVYIDSTSNGLRSPEKIIRLEVPVNMRRLLPSKTMRNFSLFVMPEIDLRLGEYTFEEIVRVVYHYMRAETDIRLIKRIITRNVKPEHNWIIRVMPLFIKNIALTAAFHKHGATKYASVLTNMGVIKMPDECSELIKHFSVTPPPPTRKLKVSCGMIGYGSSVLLTFANITRSRILERRILKFLAARNIKVKIINPNKT